jgi:hypothetical protein
MVLGRGSVGWEMGCDALLAGSRLWGRDFAAFAENSKTNKESIFPVDISPFSFYFSPIRLISKKQDWPSLAIYLSLERWCSRGGSTTVPLKKSDARERSLAV